MENGWIKLHRSILRWEWWDDRNVRDLFLYCLLAANHEETRWHGEVVPRGSFVTSLSKLAKGAGLTVKETRRAIEKLESTNELGTQRTNQYSVITINKYEKYQLRKEDEGQAEGTQRASEGHTDGQAKGNKQEIEEYNNIINNISLTHRACDIYNKQSEVSGQQSVVKSIYQLGEELKEEFAGQTTTAESAMRMYKMTREDLLKAVDAFNDKLTVAGETVKNRSDYRRYFMSWLVRARTEQSGLTPQPPLLKEKGNSAEARLHNVGQFENLKVEVDF